MIAPEIKEIEAAYKSSYSTIHQSFLETQSDFLKDIYNRYNSDMDNANIVLFFARNLHKRILRERDTDLDHDISLQNFWSNHSNTLQKKLKIIDIAKITGLPKETTRRKMQELIKLKILKKTNNRIFWEPIEKDKESYNNIINTHIHLLTSYIDTISTCLKLKLNKENVKNEIKSNFSFYWFHYLNTQLKYLKICKDKFKDLEILLILLQCSIQENKNYVKDNISWFDIFKIKKETKNVEISATSISMVTGIPRATCIRKLEKMKSKKIIMKDPDTKRYYSNTQENINLLDNVKISKDIIKIFSEFYFILIKGFLRNNKNLILKS